MKNQDHQKVFQRVPTRTNAMKWLFQNKDRFTTYEIGEGVYVNLFEIIKDELRVVHEEYRTGKRKHLNCKKK